MQIIKSMIIALAVFLLALVAIGIINVAVNIPAWPAWTGLNGKTVWDFVRDFSALILLLALILAYARDRSRRYDLDRITALEAARQHQDALDQRREAALQTYLTHMKELLLHENLRRSGPQDEVRAIARTVTVTAMLQLDGRRNEILLQFLEHAGLFNEDNLIIRFDEADLRQVDLSQTVLPGIDFSRANLGEANLAGASLKEANLTGANLREANLKRTNLWGAVMEGADLWGTNLEGADLGRANLGRANLRAANLGKANLGRAGLEQANLREADLGKADLKEVNLVGANLTGASLKRANLAGVTYNYATEWPKRFNPPPEAINEDLNKRATV